MVVKFMVAKMNTSMRLIVLSSSPLQLAKLCSELDRIYLEAAGEVVVFEWVQFLSEETAQCLGLADKVDLRTWWRT